MKRLLLIPLLLVLLTGCITPQQIGTTISAVTTTITNPIRSVDIYRIKLVYSGALKSVTAYRQYCWSKPYAELMADPVAKAACQSRRPNVRAMQAARWKARAAITVAQNFVKENPTINGGSAVTAAWKAVTDFQTLVIQRSN